MATSGDGQQRSDQRRQSKTICVRCTEAKRLEYQRIAKRQGFDTLSAWITDLICSSGTASLQMRRVVSGKLGQIGARISELTHVTRPDELNDEVTGITHEITKLQHYLIKGDIRAGKGD